MSGGIINVTIIIAGSACTEDIYTMLKKLIAVLCVFCVCICAGVCASAEGISPELSRDIVNLFPGQSYRLTLTESSVGRFFVTNDTSVAQVDSNGIITAMNTGSTDIICILKNKTELRCKVNVLSGQSPQEVWLDKQTLSLSPGETAAIEARVLPEKNNQQKSFISSDKSVAVVDAGGNITAVAPGNAVITAESESTAVSAGCLVTVADGRQQSDVSKLCGVLYDASGEKLVNTQLELQSGDFLSRVTTNKLGQFTFENVPAGNAILTVFSGNDKSAGAEASRNTDSESSEGISSVIIAGKNNQKLNCILTDNALCVLYGTNESTALSLREIKLSEDHINLESGSHYDIIYSLEPEKADAQGLIFSSDNTNVAAVDNTGRITAMNEGNTIIRVSSADGSISAAMTVHVSMYSIGLFGVTVIVMLVLIAVLIVTVFLNLRGRKKGE